MRGHWCAVLLALCSTVSGLNQATCDALDGLSSGVVTCNRNTACNSTVCTSSLLSGYSLTLDLLSCRTPPGIHVIVNQGSSSIYNQVVDHSVSGINVGIGTLSITIDQLENNQIGLRVRIGTFLGSTDLIPYTTIPLDTQSCLPPTTAPPSTTVSTNTTTLPPPNSTASPSSSSSATTTTALPTSTPSGGNPATCQGLDHLISNVTEMTCTRNQDCNQADCTITNPTFAGHTLTMTLLSCRQPRPGVRIVAMDPSGNQLLDRVVDESVSGVELTSDVDLDITLNQLGDSIGIAASVSVDLGFTTLTLPILSYTIVPLDRRECPGNTTVSPPTNGTTATTNTTTMVPSTGPTGTTESYTEPTGTTVEPSTGPNGTTIEPSTGPNGTTIEPPTGPSDITMGPTNVTTVGPSTGPNGTTVEPPPATTPIPNEGKNTTCYVLDQLARNAEFFSCTADSSEPCDTVNCSSSFGYDAVIILLPCRSPAAIRLTITQGDSVILNETVDHSKMIPVPALLGLVLDVTIDQFSDAIGLQVTGTLSDQTFNIVKYTVIPLERNKTCTSIEVVEKTPETETKDPDDDDEEEEATSDSQDNSSDSSSATYHLHWSLLLLSFIIITLPLY